jgi:hypothetical protein
VSTRLRFEHLVGRQVRNTHGRVIGRIEDARIEPDGEDYVITHFLLGPLGRITRLRAFLGEVPTLIALRIGHERNLRPLPWDWFDLTDPEQPVLTEKGSRT